MTVLRYKHHLAVISLVTLTTFTAASCAAPGGRGSKPKGPPPEAFEACSALSEEETCSFSGRRGSVEGKCLIPPREESLVCVPDGRPRHEKGERD